MQPPGELVSLLQWAQAPYLHLVTGHLRVPRKAFSLRSAFKAARRGSPFSPRTSFGHELSASASLPPTNTKNPSPKPEWASTRIC